MELEPDHPEASKELAEIEARSARKARFEAWLNGGTPPQDSDDRIAFAQLAYDRGLYVASVRLATEAFRSNPKLAEDRRPQHRYNAACSALLAAAGKGKDIPAPDETAKTKFRRRALDWLKAEVAAWASMLDQNEPSAHQTVARALQHWFVDPDLAGIRDAAALTQLTSHERDEWNALWNEVQDLLKRASP